jgi:hypothetical protein
VLLGLINPRFSVDRIPQRVDAGLTVEERLTKVANFRFQIVDVASGCL